MSGKLQRSYSWTKKPSGIGWGTSTTRPRPNHTSKLDPYKPRIKAWLEAHDLSAQQILQRLREEGLQIGYTVVREYVRRVRPKPVKAFLSLHFCPGECLQVDWGSWGFIIGSQYCMFGYR